MWFSDWVSENMCRSGFLQNMRKEIVKTNTKPFKNPSLIETRHESPFFYIFTFFLAKTHFSIGDTQQFLAIYFHLKVKLASLGIAMLYLRFFHAVFFGFHCFFSWVLGGFCNINFLVLYLVKKVVVFNFLKVEKLYDFWRLDLVIFWEFL